LEDFAEISVIQKQRHWRKLAVAPGLGLTLTDSAPSEVSTLGGTNNDDLGGGDGVFGCKAVIALLAVLFICVYACGVVFVVCECV